jgi:hypothetical protein
MSSYEELIENSIDGKIYCHSVYQFTDELIKLGFYYFPQIKKWGISTKKFNEYIYNKSRILGLNNYSYFFYITKYDEKEFETIKIFSKNNKINRY